MRRITAGLLGLSLAAPAAAQDLGQVGRLLGDQLLPRAPQQQPNQDYERQRAYEQGRRDAEEERRSRGRRDDAYRDREDDRRRSAEGARRARDGERQRSDDASRRDRDYDRQRTDGSRGLADQRRPRRQSDDN